MGHIETPNYSVLNIIVVILKVGQLRCRWALKLTNPQLMHNMAEKNLSSN
jgi:hypothetical protein